MNLASVAKRSRNFLWMQARPYGHTEIRYRRRKLSRSLWDIEYLLRLPSGDARALDVGANIGIYTSVLADRFRLVDSFEPNPNIGRRLRASCPDNVLVWPCALSSLPGTAELLVPRTPSGEIGGLGSLENPFSSDTATARHTVRKLTLDQLAYTDVTLIKIDVEGHEMDVLRGAERLLSTATRMTLLVESEERHAPGSPERVRDFLAEHGFRGEFAWQGKVIPADEFVAAIHQQEHNVDIPHGYANVFHFVKGDSKDALRTMASAVASTYRASI